MKNNLYSGLEAHDRWGADLNSMTSILPMVVTAVLLLLTSVSTNAQSLGSVIAWGDNQHGEITVPLHLTNVVAIAGAEGGSSSVALRVDGTIAAWGTVFGTPSEPDKPAYVPIGLSNVIGIAASEYHILALKSDHTVVAWGSSYNGVTNVPPEVTNVIAISAGNSHALALRRDGTVVRWGFYGNPTIVLPAFTNVVAISGVYGNSMALREDGTVAVVYGSVPPGLTNIVRIAGGSDYAMAVRSDGSVVMWDPDTTALRTAPPEVTNVVAVAGGVYHWLALRDNGTVVSWGDNTYGQTNVPAFQTNVVAVAAGFYHSLALVGQTLPPLKVRSVRQANGSLTVSVPTQSGHVYRLEYKNSLTDFAWTPLPLVAGTGETRTLVDSAATSVQRFYRVRYW
jgi:alpha-tubulin suppressor-like RCC1 family protein